MGQTESIKSLKKKTEAYLIENKKSFIKVNVDLEVEDNNKIQQIMARKKNEKIFRLDYGSQQKRWSTGLLSEKAVGKHIGQNFCDFSNGHSSDYAYPDLKSLGLNIGVKSATFGNCPLIYENHKTPEIIVIRENNIFYILGVALPHILNTYQTRSLIKSKKHLEFGKKTAFYGFEHLLPFDNLDDLREIENWHKKSSFAQ